MVSSLERPTAVKRILIVDDHPAFRNGLAYFIEPEPDLEICGQAASSREALDFVAKNKPDLVISDLSLPDKNGLELLKDLRALHPDLRVLVVSMHDELLYAERVLRAGGRGYLMKENSDKVTDAVRKILSGEVYVSRAVTNHFLTSLVEGRNQSFSFPLSRLTDRELEVFELIGNGIANEDIATQLGISSRTVDAHRAHIREKLRLADSNELLRFAVRWIESGVQPSPSPAG